MKPPFKIPSWSLFSMPGKDEPRDGLGFGSCGDFVIRDEGEFLLDTEGRGDPPVRIELREGTPLVLRYRTVEGSKRYALMSITRNARWSAPDGDDVAVEGLDLRAGPFDTWSDLMASIYPETR